MNSTYSKQTTIILLRYLNVIECNFLYLEGNWTVCWIQTNEIRTQINFVGVSCYFIE